MIRSRMSQYMPEAPAEKAEPRPIPPPLYLLAGLAAVAVLSRLAPNRRPLPRPVRGLGLLGILAGVGMAVWSAMIFRRVDTTLDSAGEPKFLVTEGPFRLSRNPMYLAMAILLAGAALLMGALLPLLILPIFIGLLTARVIRREEETLADRFGSAYKEYSTKVRRWL